LNTPPPWHVPDATALELIEFPGKLGKERIKAFCVA
jgi:hypothetical protein